MTRYAVVIHEVDYECAGLRIDSIWDDKILAMGRAGDLSAPWDQHIANVTKWIEDSWEALCQWLERQEKSRGICHEGQTIENFRNTPEARHRHIIEAVKGDPRTSLLKGHFQVRKLVGHPDFPAFPEYEGPQPFIESDYIHVMKEERVR